MNIASHIFSHPRRTWLIAAVFTAMAFGFICILPNVWQRFDSEYPFKGIEMMGTDQEYYYATRIREVQDGFWTVGSPYYAEYKDRPFVQPPFPEIVMAGLGTVLRLDPPRTAVFAKAFFGALTAFMMIVFCALVSRRPWWAILAASAWLFSGFIFSAPHLFFDILSGQPAGSEFLRFSRLTNPGFSSFFFFLALCAFTVWAQERSKKALLSAGIITGLCFYIYPYAWSFLGFVFAASTIYMLAKKDWKRTGDMILLAGIIGVVALPYFLHQLILVQPHPEFPVIAERFILLKSRDFIGGVWITLFLSLPLIALIVRREFFRPLWLIGALSIAAFVALNQHVITGYKLMPLHYHWFFSHPLAVMLWFVFAATVIIDPLLKRFVRPQIHVALFISVLFICIGFGLRFQQDSYIRVRDEWGGLQEQASLLSFLESSVQPGTVVFVPQGLIRELVTIYTAGDSYDADNAPLCLCPDDRRLTPYYLELWLNGVSADEARSTFFTSRRLEVSSRYRGSYYREAYGAYDRIPDEDIKLVLSGYEQYLELSADDKLSKYLLHFMVIPRTMYARGSDGLNEVISRSEEVFENGLYIILRLKPDVLDRSSV